MRLEKLKRLVQGCLSRVFRRRADRSGGANRRDTTSQVDDQLAFERDSNEDRVDGHPMWDDTVDEVSPSNLKSSDKALFAPKRMATEYCVFVHPIWDEEVGRRIAFFRRQDGCFRYKEEEMIMLGNDTEPTWFSTWRPGQSPSGVYADMETAIEQAEREVDWLKGLIEEARFSRDL